MSFRSPLKMGYVDKYSIVQGSVAVVNVMKIQFDAPLIFDMCSLFATKYRISRCEGCSICSAKVEHRTAKKEGTCKRRGS